jgi:ABC-type polysaccharide/polyol phosphate export permease
VWTLLVPTAMALVYFFIFDKIAKIQVPHYGLFLICGVIPWTFFSVAVLTSTESLVNNFGILNKVPIAFAAFPLAECTSDFINLLLSLPVLLAACLFEGLWPNTSWLILPVVYLCLFCQAYAFSLISAISYVYLRDTRHLLSIAMQIWLYMTPILYADNLIPEKYHPLFYINPLYSVFSSFHIVIIKQDFPPVFDILHLLGFSSVLLLVAGLLYRKTRYSLIERI